MRDFFEMNEIIPGELWFEIARRNFSVWCVLTKTIRVFWLHVRKIGRERIVEKLFGSVHVYDKYFSFVEWFIEYRSHRFGGLPRVIDIYGPTWWYPKGRSLRGNPLIIDNSHMGFAEPSHRVREMFYDGLYITGADYSTVCHNPDNSSTLSARTRITLQEIYFISKAHRCAVEIMRKNGLLKYLDFTGLRNQNLPRFLGRDGLFLPNV